MGELLRDLVRDLREPMLRDAAYGLTRWQWIAGPVLLLLALVLGALLGRATRAVLMRLAKRTETEWDDVLAQKMGSPLTAAWMIAILWVAYPVLELSKSARGTFQQGLRGAAFAVLFWIIARAIGVASKVTATSAWGQARPISRSLVPLAARVAKVALFALAIVTLLSELGVPVTSLVAGLGLGGLAFALAAQKTVENLFGAFSIGADRPFAEGDLVKIEDFVGTVERIGLRSTRFRTADRTLITIPNGKLAEMRIESYTARDRYRFATTLALVYETRAEQLQQVLERIDALLRAQPSVWPDGISVRLVRLSASSLEIEVSAWFAVPSADDFQDRRQDVLLGILRIVEEAGTALAYPTQMLRVASDGGGKALAPAGLAAAAAAAPDREPPS